MTAQMVRAMISRSRCSTRYSTRGSSSDAKCFSSEPDSTTERLMGQPLFTAILKYHSFKEYAIALREKLRIQQTLKVLLPQKLRLL
jgi:hypothetical protein